MRWYPQTDQVNSPAALQRTLKQVLDQHYALQDQVKGMQPPAAAPATAPASTSGPSSTQFLGLPVAPIDTATLADGATLTWDKKNGTFKFM